MLIWNALLVLRIKMQFSRITEHVTICCVINGLLKLWVSWCPWQRAHEMRMSLRMLCQTMWILHRCISEIYIYIYIWHWFRNEPIWINYTSRSVERRQLLQIFPTTLQWRHNGQCLFHHLFRRRSKKTSKLRVSGLCAGNSPGTGEFPAQMARNAENLSIRWRHHEVKYTSSKLQNIPNAHSSHFAMFVVVLYLPILLIFFRVPSPPVPIKQNIGRWITHICSDMIARNTLKQINTKSFLYFM